MSAIQKRLAELLRERAVTIPAADKPVTTPTATSAATPATNGKLEWNDEQKLAIQYGSEFRPFCLIGAAGTGKTTTIKEIVNQIAASNRAVIPADTKSSHLRPKLPAVAFVSFTNRAVQNIRKVLKDSTTGLEHHCLTIHKLLEFYPQDLEVYDESMDAMRRSMRFVPKFDAYHPLLELRLIVVEESSMVGTPLFKQLVDACPNAIFIFIGDLNQLKPVFGDAILGFKLAELPVVELTRVYRQAMESPIIAFQHNWTLKGRLPSDTELQKHKGALEFWPLKMKLTNGAVLCKAMADRLMRERAAGNYDENSDIVLIPFNKDFGTLGINREIAQYLGDERNAVVHEIISGFEKLYLAVGDKVIHNRTEYTVKSISPNKSYVGKAFKTPSEHLLRTGKYRKGHAPDAEQELLHTDLEAVFESVISDEDVESLASHEIELAVYDPETGEETYNTIISTKGDINNLIFAYCLTVHKSQGSEWRRVFLVTTNHHSVMLTREILYTGMTRAREELRVVYSPQSQVGVKDNSIAKAIKRQQVKGKTWQEKVEVFKGKYDAFSAEMARTSE